MKNILVTGAAGFIGANFAELMVKKYEGKYNIIVFDKLTYAGNIETLDEAKKNENFVFFDGPATANGMPGLHHMVAKNLKDEDLYEIDLEEGFKEVKVIEQSSLFPLILNETESSYLPFFFCVSTTS